MAFSVGTSLFTLASFAHGLFSINFFLIKAFKEACEVAGDAIDFI